MKCKHCAVVGFVNKTHHRVHEDWCNHKNPTEFVTKSGVGIKKLSGKAVASNFETIWKYIKKHDR